MMSCWGFSISPTPSASRGTWSSAWPGSGLALNAEKTRLIRFGRFAAQQRAERGLGKPETFDFLGFTHLCGKTKDGRFAVRRRTIKKRMAAKLKRGQDLADGAPPLAHRRCRDAGSAPSCADTSRTTRCRATSTR